MVNLPTFTVLVLTALAFLAVFANVGRGVGADVVGANVGSLGSSISVVEGLLVEVVGVALGGAEGLEVGYRLVGENDGEEVYTHSDDEVSESLVKRDY
eukprot:scaffold10750_cov34-Cyclotella_meneghiniana.AAC.1